jgi:hypothetical protein
MPDAVRICFAWMRALVVSPAQVETAVMDLDKAVAALALIIGGAVVTGYSQGTEHGRPSDTIQDRLVEREALRRAALQEYYKRKEDFVRRCNGKAFMTSAELEACRAAYRKL